MNTAIEAGFLISEDSASTAGDSPGQITRPSGAASNFLSQLPIHSGAQDLGLGSWRRQRFVAAPRRTGGQHESTLNQGGGSNGA